MYFNYIICIFFFLFSLSLCLSFPLTIHYLKNFDSLHFINKKKNDYELMIKINKIKKEENSDSGDVRFIINTNYREFTLSQSNQKHSFIFFLLSFFRCVCSCFQIKQTNNNCNNMEMKREREREKAKNLFFRFN